MRLEQGDNDGELFSKLRKLYEATSGSKLPLGLRFRRPERVIFMKVSLSS
jgi:hypothetical protein